MLFELDTVELGTLRGLVEKELVESVSKLDTTDYGYRTGLIIVSINGERVEILDGYHRAAGLLSYTDDDESEVSVIVCHNDELAGVIADKCSCCEAHEAAVALANALAR